MHKLQQALQALENARLAAQLAFEDTAGYGLSLPEVHAAFARIADLIDLISDAVDLPQVECV